MKWVLEFLGPWLSAGIGAMVVFLFLIYLGMQGDFPSQTTREEFLQATILFGIFATYILAVVLL